MRENFWLKVASVVFAIALWVFVISRGYSDMSMAVPVEFVNVPTGMQVVESGSSGTVALSIRGHERLIKGLGPKDVRVVLDANGLAPGSHKIEIDKDNVELPVFVRLVNINPPVATVLVEEAAFKSVPVRPDIVGDPASGYRVMRMKVTPGNVNVSGGKSRLEKLNWVKTETVDIEGARTSMSQKVRVALPGEGLKADPDSVKIEITIERSR